MNTDTNSPLCRDWVFLINANVHVAKDRGWFKTYTPFTSTVNGTPFYGPGNYSPVLGIGTVEIPTKRSPCASGFSSHRSLILHDVLHVPDFICNIIGQTPTFEDRYYASTHPCKRSYGTIKDRQGWNAAYFYPRGPLLTIKVRSPPNGPKLGPHTLETHSRFFLGCRSDDAEHRRWIEFKASNSLSTPPQNNAPYTAEETAFLKKNYRSEFHFLTEHGLKIHSEEDREEGRAILRAIMRAEDISEDEHSEGEEGDSDEFDLEGHQADYNFTERQLHWIEKYYRNSEQFMISYGLKFYDDEDLEEAKAIVEAMMHEDD